MYVKNERNMGFAFSANKGASLAEGEYILFLNSDTILIQGELEKMVRFMDRNADVAICGPQLVYSRYETAALVRRCTVPCGRVFPANRGQGSRVRVIHRWSNEESGTDPGFSDSRFTILRFTIHGILTLP